MTHYWLRDDNQRAAATLHYVTNVLSEAGTPLIDLDADDSKIPFGDRSGRHIESQFAHTPEPLISAWRTSRNLQAKTRPGDLILMSDHFGLGGIFALTQLRGAEQGGEQQGMGTCVWVEGDCR
jgi:hypothetical protein